MSSMGRLAQLVQQARQNQPHNGNGSSFHVTAHGALIGATIPGSPGDKPDLCFGGDEDCSDTGFSDGPGATQSEMSVAVDRTGKHIVVGFNDFRGFSTPRSPRFPGSHIRTMEARHLLTAGGWQMQAGPHQTLSSGIPT